MDITKPASAGTVESSDVYIEVRPAADGISIQLESIVKAQYGDKIEKTVREVLGEHGVESAELRVMDRGALECVIRARVETALMRARGDES